MLHKSTPQQPAMEEDKRGSLHLSAGGAEWIRFLGIRDGEMLGHTGCESEEPRDRQVDKSAATWDNRNWKRKPRILWRTQPSNDNLKKNPCFLFELKGRSWRWRWSLELRNGVGVVVGTWTLGRCHDSHMHTNFTHFKLCSPAMHIMAWPFIN